MDELAALADGESMEETSYWAIFIALIIFNLRSIGIKKSM
jgi:hypothetical protein